MNSSITSPVKSAPACARTYVARCAALAVVWLLLNGDDWNSWIAGVPAVLVAAWLSIRLTPTRSWRLSLRGCAGFCRFFLQESLRGAWIVARHALSTQLRISPGLLRHEFRLPPGAARWFFCNTVSLLPGTAVVAIEADWLCAHVLDLSAESARELQDLERRVAALFDLPWTGKEENQP